jgi:hypothetical protein
MRSTGDQQALNDDGTPRRKYEIAEPHDSKIFLRATIGLVLANAAILIKNILYPSEAKAAFSLPSFAPIQPLEGGMRRPTSASRGDHIRRHGRRFRLAGLAGRPGAIGPGSAALSGCGRIPGRHGAVRRQSQPCHSSGLPLAGNNNPAISAAPGSAISLFAKEAADTRGPRCRRRRRARHRKRRYGGEQRLGL